MSRILARRSHRAASRMGIHGVRGGHVISELRVIKNESRVIKNELGELKDMVRLLAAGQRLSLTALGGGADSSAEELKTELRCVTESVRELREQVVSSLAPVPEAAGRCGTAAEDERAPPHSRPAVAAAEADFAPPQAPH